MKCFVLLHEKKEFYSEIIREGTAVLFRYRHQKYLFLNVLYKNESKKWNVSNLHLRQSTAFNNAKYLNMSSLP